MVENVPQGIAERGRNGCVHSTQGPGFGLGVSVVSGLPYSRTVLAPSFPEIPEKRLLLLALFPSWIFQGFFFGGGWQGCWTTGEEKKCSVD